MGELLRGYETLLASGAEAYFINNQRKHSSATRQAEYSLQALLNITSVLTSLALWIPNIAVMLIGAMLVFDGYITFGSLITSYMLATFIITPMRVVSSSYASLVSTHSVREKIIREMTMPEMSLAVQILDSKSPLGDVSIRNLSFSYEVAETLVLNSISLEVASEEKIAIVGNSGSGKSTLLKIIFRYFSQYQGEIRIGKYDLQELDLKSYYNYVAFVPQTTFAFSDSIYNNITLDRDLSEEDVQRAIDLAGLKDFIDGLEKGWDTDIAENGTSMSGGQMQRIGIARALLGKCDLLLLDEVTSNLDLTTSNEVMERLLELNCSIIAVTHNIFNSYMDRFDTIYYLEDGQVAEQGTFATLLEKEGAFYSLYIQGKPQLN